MPPKVGSVRRYAYGDLHRSCLFGAVNVIGLLLRQLVATVSDRPCDPQVALGSSFVLVLLVISYFLGGGGDRE